MYHGYKPSLLTFSFLFLTNQQRNIDKHVTFWKAQWPISPLFCMYAVYMAALAYVIMQHYALHQPDHS